MKTTSAVWVFTQNGCQGQAISDVGNESWTYFVVNNRVIQRLDNQEIIFLNPTKDSFYLSSSDIQFVANAIKEGKKIDFFQDYGELVQHNFFVK